MTDSRAAQDACRAELRDLAWSLACARGALSEIATCWRRSASSLPGLPLGLPLRLMDAVGRIEADAGSLAAGGLGQAAGPAAEVAGRMAALRLDIALARGLTRGPGMTGAGDGLLWESAAVALRQAANRLLCLIVYLVRDADWSLDGAPGPAGRPGPALLLVTLGQVPEPN